MTHPPIHVLLYGESGSGKSTFAATFPKPMLVWSWDPHGKETPYLRTGTPGDLVEAEGGYLYRDVLDAAGAVAVRIEYHHEGEVTADGAMAPVAYPRYLARMAGFSAEYEWWSTVVCDSLTFMELSARKYHQYVLNPRSKEPRQWFAGATDALEEMLMFRFGGLRMNVCVLAHVDEDKDEMHGAFIRNPKAPGRLRKGAAAGYAEFYRSYVRRNEQGHMDYLIQTRADNLYNASTQIGAPDPCIPHYDALWQPAPTPARTAAPAAPRRR